MQFYCGNCKRWTKVGNEIAKSSYLETPYMLLYCQYYTFVKRKTYIYFKSFI